MSIGPSLNLLCDEKQKLDHLLDSYKSTKLPQLAEALATETMSLSTTSDRRTNLKTLSDNAISEFSKTAKNIANEELVQSEINHVLLRAAQMYQSNMDADHAYFFSFFASERAALELWADSVSDCLYDEINKSIGELNTLYQNSLNKLQKQNWRYRVELERNSRTPTNLLHEYADIIAHKALIDARIAVLSGNVATNAGNADDHNFSSNSLSSWLQNEENWSYLENQSISLINQSLEAEFSCMLDKFSNECYAMLNRPELKELLGYLEELTEKVEQIQRCVNLPTVILQNAAAVKSWSDVCRKCESLRDSLEEIYENLERSTPLKR